MTVKELQQKAKQLGLVGYSKLKKRELSLFVLKGIAQNKKKHKPFYRK